ncbi:MAG: hypothetical protein ACLTMP_01395 [Eggerthella lenta]
MLEIMRGNVSPHTMPYPTAARERAFRARGFRLGFSRISPPPRSRIYSTRAE